MDLREQLEANQRAAARDGCPHCGVRTGGQHWSSCSLCGTVGTAATVGAATLAVPANNQPEALIEAECCKFLEADGWRILKTSPVSRRGRGVGFGEIGMADTLAIRYPALAARHLAELLWIEWKARGGKPASHQLTWHLTERARGARTLIASVDFPASVDGFRAWYLASGLMHRRRWW